MTNTMPITRSTTFTHGTDTFSTSFSTSTGTSTSTSTSSTSGFQKKKKNVSFLLHFLSCARPLVPIWTVIMILSWTVTPTKSFLLGKHPPSYYRPPLSLSNRQTQHPKQHKSWVLQGQSHHNHHDSFNNINNNNKDRLKKNPIPVLFSIWDQKNNIHDNGGVQQSTIFKNAPWTSSKTLISSMAFVFLCTDTVIAPITTTAAHAATVTMDGQQQQQQQQYQSSSSTSSSTTTTVGGKKRYWTIMESAPPVERLAANEALLDYAVGTINTQYYDNTGGERFYPKDFYQTWKTMKQIAESNHQQQQDKEVNQQQVEASVTTSTLQRLYNKNDIPPDISLDSREGAVQGLKWLVNTLDDPFSKYLTREELKQELDGGSSSGGTGSVAGNCGFLGTGAVVEPPQLLLTGSNTYGSVVGSSSILTPSIIPVLSSSSTTPTTTAMAASASSHTVTPGTSTGTGIVNSNNAKMATLASMTNNILTWQQQQKQQLQLSNLVSSFRNSNHLHHHHHNYKNKYLTISRVANLPVITAVAPDSPAERAGLVVGDRIVAVGNEDFLGWTQPQVAKALKTKYNAESYIGYAQLTVAKPVYSIDNDNNNSDTNNNNNIDNTNKNNAVMRNNIGGGGGGGGNHYVSDNDYGSDQLQTTPPPPPREVVIGYRQARVLVPSKATSDSVVMSPSSTSSPPPTSSSGQSPSTASLMVAGGDNIVHYELLSSSSGSIFDHLHSDDDGAVQDDYKVGYIRLTRFSKKSTEGYLKAIQELEAAGAQSYILDLRNNYGGVIQEAMLTASTLLRDPHAILCYTMNARGGFTPHDVEEYVVDKRYPGYLLSRQEPKTATLDQVRKESPGMFEDSGIAWDPPSSFASLHEQVTKRGIRRISYSSGIINDPVIKRQLAAQKKIVLLINEGTASSAEVFTAALHDNARTVALVGTKTYGKGLIQHTFPMPDGGGLRITVAEYLTPSLKHVTHVGGARFDQETGTFIGGGIRPDISCESKGIPRNIRADLCVGVALDVLEEAASEQREQEEAFEYYEKDHQQQQRGQQQGLEKLVGPFASGIPSSLLGSRPVK